VLDFSALLSWLVLSYEQHRLRTVGYVSLGPLAGQNMFRRPPRTVI
jgi:hypothetical protein